MDPSSSAPNNEHYNVDITSVATLLPSEESPPVVHPGKPRQRQFVDLGSVMILVSLVTIQTFEVKDVHKLLPLCRRIFVRNIHEIGIT